MSDRLAVRTKPGAAYPQAAALQTALKTGDWPAGQSILASVGATERTTLLRVVEDTKRADVTLTRALADDPTDNTAAALLGFRQISAAWRIRTSASASQVGRRRFARFHDGLRQADRTLFAGLAAAPGDPALWTALLTTTRGLEHGQDVARERYARLAEIDPHHLPGQSQRLQQLCPKWGGTWDAAFGFAREAMRTAPEGAPNAVVLVEAHLERWLDLGAGYLRSPAVRDEIVEAAERSVLHADFRRDIGWVPVLNTFAMAFGLLRDRKRAALMFDALGPHYSEFPWKYFPDGVSAFRRDRALARGLSASAAADIVLAAFGPVSRRGALALLGMAWR